LRENPDRRGITLGSALWPLCRYRHKGHWYIEEGDLRRVELDLDQGALDDALRQRLADLGVFPDHIETQFERIMATVFAAPPDSSDTPSRRPAKPSRSSPGSRVFNDGILGLEPLHPCAPCGRKSGTVYLVRTGDWGSTPLHEACVGAWYARRELDDDEKATKGVWMA
jgi:hypothetical protein